MKKLNKRKTKYPEQFETPPLCKCKCGEPVKWNKGKNCWNKYINYHSRRGAILTKEEKDNISAATKEAMQRPEVKEKTLINAEKSRKRMIENNPMDLPGVREKHNKAMACPKYRKRQSELSKGRIRTEEHNEKVSVALIKFHKNLSSEEKEKRNRSRTGEKRSKEARKNMSIASNKKFENQSERDKISVSVTKLWEDPEYRKMQLKAAPAKRDKQSKAAIERIKRNPRTAGGYGKSGHFFSEKNNKNLWYRSSYELIAYKILEQLSKVKFYEVESLCIRYEYQNSKHRTAPDLLVTYIDDTKELIEVKPEWRLEDEQTVIKLEAMENYALDNNWLFSIWSEKQLGLN